MHWEGRSASRGGGVCIKQGGRSTSGGGGCLHPGCWGGGGVGQIHGIRSTNGRYALSGIGSPTSPKSFKKRNINYSHGSGAKICDESKRGVP